METLIQSAHAHGCAHTTKVKIPKINNGKDLVWLFRYGDPDIVKNFLKEKEKEYAKIGQYVNHSRYVKNYRIDGKDAFNEFKGLQSLLRKHKAYKPFKYLLLDLPKDIFKGKDLSGFYMDYIRLYDLDLSGCRINNLRIDKDTIQTSTFKHAELINCVFINSDINNTTFKHAELINCVFTGSKFDEVDLSNTLLTDSAFNECIIHNSSFKRANVLRSEFVSVTFFNVILSNIKYCKTGNFECSDYELCNFGTYELKKIFLGLTAPYDMYGKQ